MKKFAAKLLIDLTPLIQKHPGYVQKAIEMAKEVNIELPVHPDPEFEALYPTENIFLIEEQEKTHQTQMLKVENVRDEWKGKNAKEVAYHLRYLEDEAELVGKNWPRYVPYLCEKFAESVDSPKYWGSVFIETGLTYDLIEPFISRAATIDEQGWQNLAIQCLEYPANVPAALYVILKHPDPERELLSRVEALPSRYSKIIETMCLRNEIPLQTILFLLRSANIEFAQSAAYGVWLSDPKSKVRPELFDDWKQVILTDQSNNHWLRDVLKSDQDVAFEWILRFLNNKPQYLYNYDNVISAVSDSLNEEQKQHVIDMIEPDYIGALIVQRFTLESNELYDHLLNIQNLRQIHLYPLIFETSEHWVEKATLALNHGYAPEDIARAVYGVGATGVTWIGNRSAKEKEYLDFFEEISSHPDQRMQLVGMAGKSIADKRVQEALAEERYKAIYGLDFRYK